MVESASVWRGCLEQNDLPKLATSLGIEQTRLRSVLDENGLSPAQRRGCLAYVAATGGEAGVASAIFRSSDAAGQSRTLAFHKTPDGIIVTPGACDCGESPRRALTLAAREFLEPGDTVSVSMPSNVRWQLDILVPQMIASVNSKGTPETDLAQAGPDANLDADGGNFAVDTPPRTEPRSELPPTAYSVRVVMGRHGNEELERLESVEIVDPGSGRVVNGAWWVDRPDGPGAMVGMEGNAYERLLWHSAVKFVRTSRGVGASFTTWRRRVPAKQGSGKPAVVKTVKVPGYHIGIDLTAPKGTDVHAVGDAKVAFAGRRGGYGNLIILDHGHGYQTYYAHLSKILKDVKAGATISRGEVIGLVGSTGRSTAPHLHFETRKDTRYLDPFDGSRQLDFWLLSADDQERLAMQLLAAPPIVADEEQR